MTSFVPRISFENEDDEATVFLALAHYARHMTGHVMNGRMGAVSELAHASELMNEIHENAHVRKEFGPGPTDKEIAEFFAHDNGESDENTEK